MPEWLILADDLTGANDTGVMFAQRGLQTVVAITPGSMPPAAVGVISSASRALPPALAAERVRTLLADLPESGSSRVYKKIDSVLRGNPAAELGALLDIRGARRALVCPALPDQQRTVRGGRVYWRGLPLEQTEFQIRSSDLTELFAPLQNRIPLCSMPLEGLRAGEAQCAAVFARHREGLWIADAETDADLAILARAAEQAGIDILCGSAGLARAIAAGIPGTPDRSALPTGGQPWLVVAGSRSPAALAQVQAAVATGTQLLTPTLQDVENANHFLQYIAPEQDCILSLVGLEEPPEQVDALLGSLVVELVQSMQPGGLFLTGGDTAAMVCGWLGTRLIELHNEVEPGVPWGRLLDGPYAGLVIITKAGSFGSPDLLARTLAHDRQYAKDRAQDPSPHDP